MTIDLKIFDKERHPFVVPCTCTSKSGRPFKSTCQKYDLPCPKKDSHATGLGSFDRPSSERNPRSTLICNVFVPIKNPRIPGFSQRNRAPAQNLNSMSNIVLYDLPSKGRSACWSYNPWKGALSILIKSPR